MDRKWCFMDLVVDHQTGKLRESSVWTNVGKAVMTWAFVYTILDDKGSEWLWLAYGGIVVSAEVVARVLNQKQQQIDKQSNI
jgi:hypothetical protein